MSEEGIILNSRDGVGKPYRYRGGLYARDVGSNREYPAREHPGLRALLDREPLKVNLFCRMWPLEDYINVDVTRVADVACHIGDLQWIETETVDEVRCINGLQHLFRENIRPILEEWVRVLKPGGKLHVEAPDIRELAKKIAEADDFDIYDEQPPLIWGLDGSQWEDDPNGDTNRNGLTRTRCKFLMEMSGLDVEETEAQTTADFCPFALVGTKPKKD